MGVAGKIETKPVLISIPSMIAFACWYSWSIQLISIGHFGGFCVNHCSVVVSYILREDINFLGPLCSLCLLR